MASKPEPFYCHGKEFRSFKEFTRAYNLDYSRAYYYKKKKKTAEEILAECQFSSSSKTTSQPKEHSRRVHVEYEGVSYNSINEAAKANGISPDQVYALKERKKCKTTEALAAAVSQNHHPRARQNCTVNGKTFRSQAEALRAYNIPAITVYSRMQRDNISFEEALEKGRKAKLYCPPSEVLFFSLELQECEKPENAQLLADLAESLRKNQCSVQWVSDLPSKTNALVVDGSIYVYYNKNAKGLEVISELSLPVLSEKINDLNLACVASKVFQHAGKAYLLCFQGAKDDASNIKLLLRIFFTFVTTKEQIESGKI